MSILPTIAQHAKQHGIAPLKKLGQNFLFDQTLCDKLASCASIKKEDLILEIGPGTGGLTRSILKLAPAKLIVIETDERCLSLLSEVKLIHPNLEIIEADALKISLSTLSLDSNAKYKIVANLPYNIATILILNWAKEMDKLISINVMVQKEVAERICAIHSNKSYGRLSVICNLLFQTTKRFDISPDVFYPKPKVWSSFISLIPKETIPTKEEISLVEQLTHAAFSMRRKMLRTSLKSIVPEAILGDINSSLRAENLSPLDYLSIAKAIANQRANL